MINRTVDSVCVSVFSGCYCEVFGHGVPTKAPTSRNYDEIRDRLRIRLENKKQCRSTGGEPDELISEHHTHAAKKPSHHLVNQIRSNDLKRDERDLDELLRFINNESENAKCEKKKDKKKKEKKKKKKMNDNRPELDEDHHQLDRHQSDRHKLDQHQSDRHQLDQHQLDQHKLDKHKLNKQQQHQSKCDSNSKQFNNGQVDVCNAKLKMLNKNQQSTIPINDKDVHREMNSDVDRTSPKTANSQKRNQSNRKANKTVDKKQQVKQQVNCNGQRADKNSYKKSTNKDSLLGGRMFVNHVCVCFLLTNTSISLSS